MTDTPKAGTLGLSVISGKTGKLVRKGQDIVEHRKTKYTHAFLVLHNEQVIEAEPGGAQVTSLATYLSRAEGTVLFSDLPVQNAVEQGANELLLRDQLDRIGRGLSGVPYNYLDYLAIGLERFLIEPRFITNRVRRQDRLICSQLVDFAYQQVGIHLFDDGRLPQDVTPGDLQFWVEDHTSAT